MSRSERELEDLCERFEKIETQQKRLREELKIVKRGIVEKVWGRKNAKTVGAFSVKIKRTLCYKPLTSVKVLMANLDLSKTQLLKRGLVREYERQTLEVRRLIPEGLVSADSFGDTSGRRRITLD